MPDIRKILVTGAGGFIGAHLVADLKRQGHFVRGADSHGPRFGESPADEFVETDLRQPDSARAVARGVEEIYALAANMGGMGFLSANNARILHDNTLINLQTLEAARAEGVRRYLYSSSACVYPEKSVGAAGVSPIREEEAYPADPPDAYGWEKLFTERLCRHYREDHRIETRIVRFHNIFGPLGTWEGGREKVPAALCRKVAKAKLTGETEIEIWGDGEQSRSFCYVDDAVEGIQRLMRSDFAEPVNLGQDRLVTINELADMIGAIAGWPIRKMHVPGPQGVRGRNADLTRIRRELGWTPKISLEEGLRRTYLWIEGEVARKLGKDRRV